MAAGSGSGQQGNQVPQFSSQTWMFIVVGCVVLFALGVFARVRNLMKISEEIESKLDYSKMKEWEDEDDWGEPAASHGNTTPEPAASDRRDP